MIATWLLLVGCLQIHCAIRVPARPGIAKPAGFNGDGFDSLPKNYWYEYSSPWTEAYDELTDIEPLTTSEPLPFFENHANSTNVTTQLGQTVTLHCRVNDLRDKTVSWVRRKNDSFHLITFGLTTYSSDSRYTLSFTHPNDWQLVIKFAQDHDEGHYECQVSSHPPRVFYARLSVVVPKVEIVDERGETVTDKFYKAGSTIELKCVISQVPQPTSYVMWRHGQRMLNYDTSRGGISVKTDIQIGGAMSRLYIANANKQDSGNYTCSLAEVASTTISVHVLNGENPAAMQHGGGCGGWGRGLWRWALQLCVSLLLVIHR